MDKHRIGIVIPAFNEERTIARIVEGASIYGLPIVIDDGSNDNTVKLAKKYGAIVIKHEKNYGYDQALNTGFKKAADLGMQIIISLDADGQHDPFLIKRFVNSIDSGLDFVLGVRNQKQRFSEYFFAWYTNLCFGIKDPLCGMKAYRSYVYEALGHFDSYGSIGTELMIFAVKKNYRFRQIQFNIQQRVDQPRFGKKLSGNYKIIRAMLLLIWRLNRRLC